MGEQHAEQERALADRLVNYADAIAALAFVGVSGVGIAVADPDSRASIARGAEWVAGANLVVAGAMTAILLVLRGWEQELRAGAPISPKAQRYSRKLHWARLAVVWFSTLQLVGIMLVIR